MNGVERIAAERQRQIDVEGWSLEHDDQHELGELATAGACYALPDIRPEWWPWDARFWKPTDRSGGAQEGEGRIRELEKAGALIAAEIDRLIREVAS